MCIILAPLLVFKCPNLQENRCMLGTYFAIILLMFIVLIVGAVFGYSQSLDELKTPLVESMSKYNPADDASADEKAITKAWDQVQSDVSKNVNFMILDFLLVP